MTSSNIDRYHTDRYTICILLKEIPKYLMGKEQMIVTIPIRSQSLYLIDVPDAMLDVRRGFL